MLSKGLRVSQPLCEIVVGYEHTLGEDGETPQLQVGHFLLLGASMPPAPAAEAALARAVAIKGLRVYISSF